MKLEYQQMVMISHVTESELTEGGIFIMFGQVCKCILTYLLGYVFNGLCASTLEPSSSELVLNAAEVGQTETTSNHLRIANNAVDNVTISDSASQFSSNALNTGYNNNNDASTSTAVESEISTDPTASGIKHTDMLEACDFVGFIGPALNEMNAQSGLNMPLHPQSNVVTFSQGC